MPHTMRRNKHTFWGFVRAKMRENCTMLTLLMAGDVAVHEGGAVHEVITGEDGFKPGLEDGSWIGTGGAHGAEDLGSLAVLGRRDLFEVRKRPIEDVAVEVVDLHTFGARTDEGLPDEMMAEATAEMAHIRVSKAVIHC